jgi:hypothetical protein
LVSEILLGGRLLLVLELLVLNACFTINTIYANCLILEIKTYLCLDTSYDASHTALHCQSHRTDGGSLARADLYKIMLVYLKVTTEHYFEKTICSERKNALISNFKMIILDESKKSECFTYLLLCTFCIIGGMSSGL